MLTRLDTGEPIPLQVRPLDRWADGSIRWLLLDLQATLSQRTQLALSIGSAIAPAAPDIAVTSDDGRYRVDTGAAVFSGSTARFWFDEVLVGGESVVDGEASDLAVCSEHGQSCALTVTRCAVEENGPVRAVLALHGVAALDDRTAIDLTTRFHFFAGSPTVKCAVSIRNPRRAAHAGGYWDLGDPGSVYLEDVSLNLVLARRTKDTRAVCSAEVGTRFETFDVPFTIYQDSSGGDNWQSSNHVNRHGKVQHRFRGYRLKAGPVTREGLRATPVVGVTDGDTGVAVAMPHFWQNFPKAVHVSGRTLALRLFPRDYSDVHEIQPGEQKTHTFFIGVGPDGVTADPLDWCRAPTIARLPAQWYVDCQVVPFFSPRIERADEKYEQLVHAAIEGPDRFIAKREIIDEYGWRHFGEIYGDHEAVRASGSSPLVSHYNNQYDAIAGFAVQFFRSGDRRWWDLMQELAAHVVDIDVYHTAEDKAAYNGGLFWHTAHYVDAATATHRTYARSKGIGGGGPGPDHNYTTGLMLHYFLTGDQTSRDAALGLARWVVDMDDGRKTVFRLLSSAPTGLPTAFTPDREPGPARPSANSVNALLDGHRLAPEQGFLGVAEALIRRVIHPHDDLAARDLLDVERKWFYTIFLQVLGKYLDFKATLDQRDAMYAYARESLLHYARWMKVHEYPYLDKPERLEFPTESWAAQDMRKSEVFDGAALHTSGAERAAFRERARFFYNASIATLSRMPTRTRARPVVIMLTTGFKHRYFLDRPDLVAPEPIETPLDFGEPTRFVPQKRIAKRRFMILMAVAALMIGLAAIAVWV